jgi:DNA segregation ATPase FtsK/SpoIIIE-like protein
VVLARFVTIVDRTQRRAQRVRRAPQRPPAPVIVRPRLESMRPAPVPAVARPGPFQPEDARRIEVSQRLFVAAARTVASSQYASTSMLQRKLRLDEAATARLMLALEGAGVVGPAKGSVHRVLVGVGELPDLFAHFGIVEDEVPSGFGPHAG